MYGSAPDAVTIGIVLVTAVAARTTIVPSVTMISTPAFTNVTAEF
jgi:hypothetical protein